MAAPFVVSIPHQLGQEEAERRIRSGLAQALRQVPLLTLEHESWADRRLDFRVRAMGQVAAGDVEVGADQVHISVVLPWFLQRFAEAAQAAISKKGALLLTKS